MIQKVKNFLLSLVQIKKITFFVFLFFIVLGLTLSLQPAQAFVVDLALNISMGIVAIVLQVVLLAANFFLAIAAWVLSWATSPGFISLPYTSGGIVDIGWTLLRDLANMGFVIALVAIGLGTALRYGEYQAQKALPRLIGVALLINFTPVICGLIIDGSNIAMNFFLEGVTAGKNFVDLTGLQGQIIGDSLGNFFNPRTDPTPLAKTIVLIAFSFIAGIFLLLYSIIFIARYVAIWVLVILSPIAFFCWILPATRKVFNDWWKQFFQWCIIGIVAAFFLYLSDQLIAEGVRNSFTAPGTGTAVPVLATSGFNEMMNSILPYGVALALLFYGFFTAISTSAMGASGIIAGAQKGAKVIPPKVGKWAGKKTATPLGRKIAPKIENLGKRMAGVGSEKAQKSIAEAKGLKRFGWGVRKKMGTTITAGARRAYREVKTSDENEIAAGKKEATNKDSADNFGIINEELKKGPLKNWNRIIGVLNGVVDNGDSNDIQGALRDGTLSGEIVGEALLTALKRGGPPASRPIAKALYGRLLSNPEQFGEGFSVEKEDDGTTIKRDEDGMPIFGEGSLAGRIVGEIPEKLKPGEIAAKILGDTIDYGKADGKEFEAHGGQMVLEQLAMMRGGDLAGSIIRRPETKKGRRKILEVISKMNPRTLYKEGASGLIKYPASSAAQGIGIPSSLSPNETNLLLNLFREEERRTLTTDEERELQDLITKWSIVPTTTKTQSATRPRKSPTPPPGTPSGWVPGPGGMWVPPQKETRSGKRPRRNPGL